MDTQSQQFWRRVIESVIARETANASTDEDLLAVLRGMRQRATQGEVVDENGSFYRIGRGTPNASAPPPTKVNPVLASKANSRMNKGVLQGLALPIIGIAVLVVAILIAVFTVVLPSGTSAAEIPPTSSVPTATSATLVLSPREVMASVVASGDPALAASVIPTIVAVDPPFAATATAGAQNGLSALDVMATAITLNPPTPTPLPSPTPGLATPSAVPPTPTLPPPPVLANQPRNVVPTLLEMGIGTYPVFASSVGGSELKWEIRPNEDEASWLQGSYVNAAFAVPYSDRNKAVFDNIQTADTIVLRYNTGLVLRFRVTAKTELRVFNTEILRQNTPGLTVVLASPPDSENRLVIQAVPDDGTSVNVATPIATSIPTLVPTLP